MTKELLKEQFARSILVHMKHAADPAPGMVKKDTRERGAPDGDFIWMRSIDAVHLRGNEEKWRRHVARERRAGADALQDVKKSATQAPEAQAIGSVSGMPEKLPKKVLLGETKDHLERQNKRTADGTLCTKRWVSAIMGRFTKHTQTNNVHRRLHSSCDPQ